MLLNAATPPGRLPDQCGAREPAPGHERPDQHRERHRSGSAARASPPPRATPRSIPQTSSGRHHRTYIAQRRQLRPSEEYRQPTAAEWEEFEAHFVKRKLSLGSCGRAYGTNCHHEHACLRCALLRVDPDQADRLRDIITNLRGRIAETEQNSWLGKVEGLKVSLAGAEDKLDQMDRVAQQRDEPVLLELRPPSAPNEADST